MKIIILCDEDGKPHSILSDNPDIKTADLVIISKTGYVDPEDKVATGELTVDLMTEQALEVCPHIKPLDESLDHSTRMTQAEFDEILR